MAYCDEIKLPEILSGNKSSTLNGTGYIFYSISPLGKEFIKAEAHPHKSILEIGAGFGNIVLESLKQGVGHYTANDISQKHLEILIARIRKTFAHDRLMMLKRLKLLCAKAPNDLPEMNAAYDAILVDKVIHFMAPNEIISFIAWCKKALKKNGKLYVLTASAHSPTYKKRLPEYLARIQKGQKFPGYFNNVMENLDFSVMQNYPQFKMPNNIMLFSRKELIELFIENDMKVIVSYSLLIPTEEKNSWPNVADECSNVVGIIASNDV